MAIVRSAILKVAGRCNINCRYCYMYNLADRTFSVQPSSVSRETVDALFEWIADHGRRHGLRSFHVSLHGGEPLLAGIPLIDYIGEKAANSSPDGGTRVTLSLLTNGLLLNEEWLDCLTRNDIHFGVSLDGPVRDHDEFRLDRAGRGTHEKVENIVRYLLDHPDQATTFTKSALAVIRPGQSGRSLVRYFYDLGLAKVDFLLPDQNYVEGSACYAKPSGSGEYGKVLMEAFDEWRRIDDPSFEVRKFELLIMSLFGVPVALDSIGTGPITVFTVETNGEVEPVDSLKICGNGFTKTGKNIRDWRTFDVQGLPLIHLGLVKDSLRPVRCSSCAFWDQCGGGYLPHRFDGTTFRETIYCADMIELCRHITNTVVGEVQRAMERRVCNVVG